MTLARLHPCFAPKVPSENHFTPLPRHPLRLQVAFNGSQYHSSYYGQLTYYYVPAFPFTFIILFTCPPYHYGPPSYKEAYQFTAKHILPSPQSGFLGRGTTSQNTILWSVMFDGTEASGEAVILSTTLSATATKSAIRHAAEV